MVESGQLTAILAFVFLSWSYGFTVLGLSKTKLSKHPIIGFMSEFAIGFATWSFMAVVFDLVHIPLHIMVYLILGSIYPLYLLVQGGKQKPTKKAKNQWWKQEETVILAILLLLMAGFFTVYHQGANVYPWFENDDPWNHAQSAMYVVLEHTYSIDPTVRELNGGYANYLEPYPPTYGVLMGLMRQLNGSVMWTLKFFNVLMITLGLAFYYLCFRQYFKDSRKAFIGTVVLGALPAFMSHFIWSQTLALVIFPIALFAFLKAIEDTSWRIPAIIAIASMMVTQPVVSLVFGCVIILAVLLLLIQELLTNKKGTFLKRIPVTTQAFIAGAGGLALSMLYWGMQIVNMGASGISDTKGAEFTLGWMNAYVLQTYTFNQVFSPPHSSRIDQAIGWGPMVVILLILTIIILALTFKRTLSLKKSWVHWHMLIWFAILAYLVFAPSFGWQGWGSSRVWAYLAIPLALLVAEGASILTNSIAKQTYVRAGILGVIAILIIMTSWPAKAAVQTAQWPPGAGWTNPQVELPGYLSMKASIPQNSVVFPVCGGDVRALGFDMISYPWKPDVAYFRSGIHSKTGADVVAFMERNGYQYLTLDPTCVQLLGENKTRELAQELTDTQRLQAIPVQDGFVLAQLT